MQVCQGRCERETDLHTIGNGQAAVAFQIGSESVRDIVERIDRNGFRSGRDPARRIGRGGTHRYRVGQFHDVIETTRFVVLADVKNVQLAGVRAGDRLEALDALKLPLEGPGIGETTPVDNLHRAALTEHIACEPHFAVTAVADQPD